MNRNNYARKLEGGDLQATKLKSVVRYSRIFKNLTPEKKQEFIDSLNELDTDLFIKEGGLSIKESRQRIGDVMGQNQQVHRALPSTEAAEVMVDFQKLNKRARGLILNHFEKIAQETEEVVAKTEAIDPNDIEAWMKEAMGNKTDQKKPPASYEEQPAVPTELPLGDEKELATDQEQRRALADRRFDGYFRRKARRDQETLEETLFGQDPREKPIQKVEEHFETLPSKIEMPAIPATEATQILPKPKPLPEIPAIPTPPSLPPSSESSKTKEKKAKRPEPEETFNPEKEKKGLMQRLRAGLFGNRRS